jgi:hypothetical protein
LNTKNSKISLEILESTQQWKFLGSFLFFAPFFSEADDEYGSVSPLVSTKLFQWLWEL